MMLNNTLVKLIKTLPRIDVQNSLMTLSDRELSLAFLYMDENDRAYALSLLSKEKRRRVGEELILQERLSITQEQYRKTTESVIIKLRLLRRGGGFTSYLRPKNYRNKKD
ncbi:MAG: hypothetical protein JW822_13580 [Spirochaetales bacterium]|nr:hypothetical protein [Spirochaetales bacterium]